MVEFWADMKKKFLDEYLNATNKVQLIHKFAYLNGMKVSTVRRWAQELEAAGLSKHTHEQEEIKLITCDKCGAQYSSKLNMCPQCAQKELEEFERKRKEEEQRKIKDDQRSKIEQQIKSIEFDIKLIEKAKLRHETDKQLDLVKKDNAKIKELQKQLKKLKTQLSKL